MSISTVLITLRGFLLDFLHPIIRQVIRTISTLPCDGICELKLLVNIHGTEKEICVLVDTGFTTGTGFGLKLPLDYVRYANYTGAGYVKVADGREVAAESIPDVKVLCIEGHQLKENVIVPTIFMGGSLAAVGMLFLQRYVLQLDGPNKIATIKI